MRAAILAGGRLAGPRAARRHLRSVPLLICADGGLRAARRLGLRPRVVLGDLDSAPAGLRAWAAARGARFITYRVHKDKTDAELAVEFAVAEGVREIEFYGALGGRLDHELANVALLLRAASAGVAMRIIDGAATAFLAGRRTVLPARVGDTVSLLALSRRVTGVTTKGLFYPLHRATLHEGSSLGVSNTVTGRPATVRRMAGDLLIIITRRRGTLLRNRS